MLYLTHKYTALKCIELEAKDFIWPSLFCKSPVVWEEVTLSLVSEARLIYSDPIRVALLPWWPLLFWKWACNQDQTFQHIVIHRPQLWFREKQSLKWSEGPFTLKQSTLPLFWRRLKNCVAMIDSSSSFVTLQKIIWGQKQTYGEQTNSKPLLPHPEPTWSRAFQLPKSVNQ